MGGDTIGLPVAAITSPTLSTISRGSSGLPVAWAGQTLVQRPHIVQASVSSSCFHVKSSTTEAPNVSSSVSARLGIGFIAPLGRFLSFRYMFSGDVNMCRSIVIGRMARKAMNATTWATHQPLVPRRPASMTDAAVDERAQRVADEAPLLVVHVLALGGLEGDAEHLGGEPADADEEERPEDERVLGLGLDADAVRPLHVAAQDRPHDAADEHEAGGVTDERVGLVRAALEELEVLGHLVVDLEHRRDAEQHEEAEVDHRVHDAGGRVAQQRAHVDAGAEVGEAPLGVLRRGAAASGPACRAPSSSSGRRTGTPPRRASPG